VGYTTACCALRLCRASGRYNETQGVFKKDCLSVWASFSRPVRPRRAMGRRRCPSFLPLLRIFRNGPRFVLLANDMLAPPRRAKTVLIALRTVTAEQSGPDGTWGFRAHKPMRRAPRLTSLGGLGRIDRWRLWRFLSTGRRLGGSGWSVRRIAESPERVEF